MSRIRVIILILAIVASAIVSISQGEIDIPLKYLLDSERTNEIWNVVLFDFRIPKMVTAVIAGIALSVSGLIMQTVFRNPLAGPYILGISSGAGLSVAVLIMAIDVFQLSFFDGSNWATITASFIGAIAVMLIIAAVGKKMQDMVSVLIVGILISGVNTSLISILQYYSHASPLKNFMIWTMGTVSQTSGNALSILAVTVLIGVVVVFMNLKALNTLILSDSYIKSVGINIKNLRTLMLICASLLTAAIVAFCGPIGFVGIVVPHICRMLFKTNNMIKLFFLTIAVGALFLLIADILTNLPTEGKLPLNSVTSLIGIPFVIFIFVENRKK